MKKILFLTAAFALFASHAMANQQPYTLTLKDHKFTPEALEIPAGQKVKITIDNQDATPEEFESHALRKEKIIQGNSKAEIVLNALKAGEYEFVGEFHEKTAKGKIIAK